MKVVILAWLVCCAAAIGHSVTFACSCPKRSTAERLSSATSVYCGHVTRVDTSITYLDMPDPDWTPEFRRVEILYEYSIAVYAVWKGAHVDTMRVRYELGHSCRVQLKADSDVLLFTRQRNGIEWTDGCLGAFPMETAFEDRYYLGDPVWQGSGYSLAPVSLDDIFNAMESSDLATGFAASAAVADIPERHDEIIARLKTMLGSESTREQEGALRAVAVMRDYDMVPMVEAALGSPSPGVRVLAHRAIRPIVGPSVYVGYGIDGLNDESDEVRQTAVEALQETVRSISDEQKESLVTAIEGAMEVSSNRTRAGLISRLGECGCAAADWIPILDTWARDDPDQSVRYAAQEAVKNLHKTCP